MHRVRVLSICGCLLLGALIPTAASASLKRIYVKQAAGAPSKTAFHAGGLKLTAQCVSEMSGGILVVRASSDVDHASIHANEQPGSSNPSAYVENDNLMTGETLPIYGLGGMPVNAFEGGQIIFSKPKGGAVSVDFAAAQNGGTANSCELVGTARVAPGGTGLVDYRANAETPSVKFFDRGVSSCGAGATRARSCRSRPARV